MQVVTKPASGTLAIQVGDKDLELQFATAEGKMQRIDDNLSFEFEDGSTVVLEGFYSAYNKDNLPTFHVDGMKIGAEEFFTALGAENLIPAAGAEASLQQAAVQGGHSSYWSTMALLEGLARLGHLDIGFDGSREVTDTLHAEGISDDNERCSEEEQIESAPEPEPTPEPVPEPTPEPEPYTATAGLDIPAVFEGQPIIGKIALDNPPTEDCIIQVKIGDSIIDVPVYAGANEAEFTVDNLNGEDPFIDASSIEAEIISITGGGYDETTIEEPSTVNILDTIDEVNFFVAGEAVDETAETARFIITSDDPVQTGSLEVVVNIGGTDYSINMELVDGSWTGHVDVPVRENDLLINGKDTIKTYVVSASHDGHEWENPSYGSATEATVVDNVDDAIFNTAISVEDGQYVVEVTSVQPYSSNGHPTLTLTVNGDERKIDLHWDEARELWTESVAYDVPAPGLDDETLHVEASISNPSMNGLEYENPILNPATKDIFIEHEHRDVQAQLDIPAVFEGSEITGTVILDIPPLEDCTITIKVGDTTIEVPVKANETEATFSIENPNGEDPFIDASSIEAEIVSINGGRYDDIELPEASTVDILDTIDEVKFSITGQDVDENAKMAVFTITSDDPVQTGSLVVTVDVDGTEHSVEMEWNGNGWTGTLGIPVRTDDLLVNGKDAFNAQIVNASHDGKVWENPNYGKPAEATVVDDKDDAVFNTAISVEDGQYVVEVTSAQPNSSEGHPSVTLTVNGEDQRLDLQWDDARELWTASSAFDLPAPTHANETVHVEASISSPSMNGLEYENPILNPAVKDIVVEHEYWPVNASLDIPPAFEGNAIIGKIVLDNPPFEDCIATIKVGDVEIEVPIPANSTEVEFTVENPNGEDPFIDASTVQAEIVSIKGGGYDSREYQEPVTVNILDTINEVKFAITGQDVDETAETTVFTITSDDPVQTGNLVVTVDVDGTEYTVPMEWTESGWSGTLEVPVRENDLLINGKDTMSAQIVSARHDAYEWENLNYGKVTEATVIDNVDDAVFNTSISVEDGQYVVEMNSSQPYSADGHPTLTLTVNGESQQVDLHWDEAREMWTESVSFDLPAPTHSDETIHVEAFVSNPSMLGLEYENPICNPAVKDIVVEHEHWAVNASLEIPSVFEGNEIAGRIILDNAPFEDCTAVVVVGNETIEVPVPANAMEVEFTVENPNKEDPFIDASSIEAHIESINGGGYDEVNIDSPINVDILDTIDEVKFAITGEAVDETATTATFTITSDDPVQTGALTVVASIGSTEHSIAMELVDGSWIGHIEVPVRENDLLINGKDTIEAYIVSARHDDYEWENPNYGGKTEATVIDNVDDAVFNTAISVVDGQYIVEVTSAQPYSSEGNPSLTLTVNGESRQIHLHLDEAREIWTESVAFDLPAPTHSDETVHVEASISNPSMNGLKYENPILNPAVKDIVVEHEPWLVNAHLEIPSVFEGNAISGKVVLDNAPFNDDCIAVVKVGDATIEVPIPANAMEAAFTVDNPNGEDPFIDASTVQAEIIEISGGGYDAVETEELIAVNILDTIDEVKFAISGMDVDETATTAAFTIVSDDPVQTGTLAVQVNIDGNEYTVPMEWVEGSGWSGSVEVSVRDNDLLINGKDTIDAYIVSAQHDNYTWENPNYGEATQSTVIDNVDDVVFNTTITAADGQYIVEVASAQPNSNEGHPTLTLTVNGEDQQIDLHWDEARELWVESVAFDLPAPTHNDETVHVEASISNPSMLGLEYENPILNSATKDIVVEHEYWPVNASLEVPSVFEGNEIAGKVILDKAPFEDGCIAIVKISDETVEVPIPANATEASFTVDNPNGEDPFIDASTIQAEIIEITGGGYDSVETEAPINVNILDTIDEVKFAIAGQDVEETAASVIFAVTSDDPVQTGTLTVVASIDGNEYTVPMEWTDENGWTGSVEVPVRDNDLLINGKDTISAYIVSAQHDSYTWENPNYDEATASTVVDNVDDAVFNTFITVADGQYVVEVTSVQPPSEDGHPALTLTVNGEEQSLDLHWDEARELWTESVAFDLPAQTHEDQRVHVEASISNPSMLGLEYENPILNPAEKDILVEHEYWPVNATLDIPSVFEGSEIAGRVILDNAPIEDCIAIVVVGDNSIRVPISAGATEASFVVDNPNGEDPFNDASAIEAHIESIEGGRYDSIEVEEPITVNILDTIDEVKFSITGQNVDETAVSVMFTVASDDPVQTGALTVVASIDGKEYFVEMHLVDGAWTGQVEVPIRENDLLINGKDTIDAYIVSAKHDSYEWENPNYGKATEATVIDNVDDAVFNTAITASNGQYVVEVTSAQPNSSDGHPTLTLTVNGESQQINLHWDNAREMWTESVSFDLPAPTHSDETVHIEASISNPSMLGLQYENPILNSAVKDIVVEHEYWPVNAHLEVPSVFEGNEIVGKITLDNAPVDDCIATVKVGDALVEVPVEAGKTEASFTVDNPNTEDPFIDASSLQAEIVSIDGGRYDEINLEDPIEVSILDTIDKVTFAIAGQNVDETAETTVFTITSDDPVQTGSLTVVASIDGIEYTVPMHWTESGWAGQVQVPVRENDLLINGKDTIEAYVVSAQHDTYEWENPDYGKATEATVIDNVDDAVFNTSITVNETAYIVEVTSAQPNSNEGHPTLILTINGESQQIDLHWDDAREVWTESVAFDLPKPTHSDETVHVEASISNPSMKGLEYENPILNPAEKDIVVEHEWWPVNASLDVPPVFEGNEIAGTIILDNAPFEDCTATVKVGDETITVPIPAGSTEVEFTVDNPNGEDPFIDASTVEAEIISINGGGYDETTLQDPITVNILDTIDEVKFTITGENVDETATTATFTVTSDDPVQTGSLTVTAVIDGQEYTVPMKWTEDGWVGTVEVPVRENDLLINGKDTIEAYVANAQHDNYEWENPNYEEATEATVIDNRDNAVFNTAISIADGQYVVEVTSSQPNSADGHPTLTLTVNGEAQQIDLHWDEARELWVESVAFDLPEPTHSDETVHVEASISNPSMMGLEYENPILNPAEKDILVEHEPWSVNASLEVPAVFEGNEIAGTVILDNAPFLDGCVAIVKVGDAVIEVPIPANASEAPFTVENPNTEDPVIDASAVQAEIIEISGGGYDSVETEAPITVNILDTIDEVKFSITGENVEETAETVAFTITSDDPVQTGSLSVVASIDGQEYTVPMKWTEDCWVGTVEVPVRENDLLINGKDTMDAYIVSAQHDSYEWENPNYGEATQSTVIDNKDAAVFNTTITVVEGHYIVEVTSTQPYSSDGHPTLTLTVNGEDQQIDLSWDATRELWTESVSYDLPAPTHSDKTLHVEASISNPSMNGMEYENPICNPAEKDIFIEHEPWPVNASLEVPAVFEGNEITGTVILDNPPLEDCVAMVKVGDVLVEVPLNAGATRASFTVENPNTEDPFIDASTVEAQIMSIDGGGYDSRTFQYPITVNILDTINEVKFAISGMDVDENTEKLVVNVTSDDPVATGSLIVQVQADGEDHFVTMHWSEENGWTGKLELPVREDNVLIDGTDAIKVEIVNAVHDNHVWENPNYGKEIELHVFDDDDITTFSTSLSVVDGACIVNVSCDQKPDEGVINADLMINGKAYPIALEWNDETQSWTTSMNIPLPAATVDGQPIHIEAVVANPSMNGKIYENPSFNDSEIDINMSPSGDSITVDESYIPTGSQNPEDSGSNEASIYLGGSSNPFGQLTWSLEILEQPDNLVALIDGLERPVELVQEEDARIVGRIHLNKSEDRDVLEVSIDEDGNAMVKMLGGASLVHGDPSNSDEVIEIDGIRAVWTEDSASGWKDLKLAFEDDAPWIGSTDTHIVDPVDAGYEPETRNLISCGPAIDFTHGTAGARFNNDLDGLQFWAAEGVTLSAGIVQYADDGWTPLEMIGVRDTLEGKKHWLQYSTHGSNSAKPWNWGLDVHSGAKWEHGREISHDIINHQGQAVVVDLNGKIAYGLTVEFGACYDPNSTVMANDQQFPEAATIIFYRNGEMVGWETATGLSKGQDERTFGSAIADGFDKAIISVPDNHSIDPNPRNGYAEVSDNDWTIRKIDFTTHPQEHPIHASEGQLEIHASADGWLIGDKAVSFWEDMIGDSINVTLADGTEHAVAITYPSKASCIQGTLEDGSILFQGVIGSDGHWSFGQYKDFSVDGENMLTLYYKTGRDADGDWSGEGVDVQTNGFGNATHSIDLHACIDSVNGVLPESSWWSVPVTVDIDENYLSEGSWVQIEIGRGQETESHALHWTGNGFESTDGFTFDWDGSKLTWNEETPEIGKLLTIAATQHWTDDSGLEHDAYSFASAQRDINGTPPEQLQEESPLADDPSLTKLANAMFADIPDAPAFTPLDAAAMNPIGDSSITPEMLYTQATSTELDAAMLTLTHSS